MVYTCEQCNVEFDSNFQLYHHKAQQHAAALGIVVDSLKRKDPPRDPTAPVHVNKYVKVRHRAPKRAHSDDEDHTGPSKRRKYSDQRGIKRLLSSDEEHAPSKYPKISQQGVKRYRSSDDEADNVKFRRISRQGKKRRRFSTSDDEQPTKFRRVNTRDDNLDSNNNGYKNNLARLKKEAERWKRLYKALNIKYNRLDKECEEKLASLNLQLKELREFEDDYEADALSKSVINSVTIEDLNRIRTLISNNQLSTVLRSRKYLKALQKLFLGLIYGVIPITAPQKIALTDAERDMVKKLETASLDNVKSYITQNKEAFLRLFEIVNGSIKLVTKSYMRYGSEL